MFNSLSMYNVMQFLDSSSPIVFISIKKMFLLWPMDDHPLKLYVLPSAGQETFKSDK